MIGHTLGALSLPTVLLLGPWLPCLIPAPGRVAPRLARLLHHTACLGRQLLVSDFNICKVLYEFKPFFHLVSREIFSRILCFFLDTLNIFN